MKESSRNISVLFHFFFLENFCTFKFSEQHEYYIRSNAIKQYIFNSPYTILYPSVFVMLRSNPYTRNYKIHKDFPKETLVNIFRPFLFYYYIIKFDIKGTNKIYNYNNLLYIKLQKFYNYNKSFGRRYIQLTKQNNTVVKKEYKFNTNHISFYGITSNTNIINHKQLLNTNTNTILYTNINTNTILNSFDTIIVSIHDNDNDTISDIFSSEQTSDNENQTYNSETTIRLEDILQNFNIYDDNDYIDDSIEDIDDDTNSIS